MQHDLNSRYVSVFSFTTCLNKDPWGQGPCFSSNGGIPALITCVKSVISEWLLRKVWKPQGFMFLCLFWSEPLLLHWPRPSGSAWCIDHLFTCIPLGYEDGQNTMLGTADLSVSHNTHTQGHSWQRGSGAGFVVIIECSVSQSLKEDVAGSLSSNSPG